MATNKTSNETKKNVTNKRSASAQVTNPANTRIVCPECGAEFDILALHEHKEKNVTVLGMDSGLGTVYLPVSKRGEALKAAGIDTSKYFSIDLPTGGSQWMRMNSAGAAVPVAADDPVLEVLDTDAVAQAIVRGGTIPNRNLFRRWIMSQVFRGLSEVDYSTKRPIGFTEWINRHGYEYQWRMMIEELHTQAKLYGSDMENFTARNRWFNKSVATAMASDYIEKLHKDALRRKQRNCKGNPYVTVGHKDYFVSDIEKKLIDPLRAIRYEIAASTTPEELENAVRRFRCRMPVSELKYGQSMAWKDAYKGAGAYYTMQNLLRFHGAKFPKGNEFYKAGRPALKSLELAAEQYKIEGWRLFGLLLQMIKENGIDIAAKRKEWRDAKAARCASRR